MKDFYKQKEEGTRNEAKKVGWLLQSYFSLMARVYQADYLTSADQAIPD